jgi:hypothetical protein
MSYYISTPSLKDQLKPIKKAPFQNINELYQLLSDRGWCRESTFLESQWNSVNKCSGQCNATVLLIKEFFGGKIMKYSFPSEDKRMHYFNKIGDCIIDLNSEQFQMPLDYLGRSCEFKSFGKYKWLCEKSCYILKLRLGLIDSN